MPARNKKTKPSFSPWATFGLRHQRDYFLENLSMLVGSGMGVLESLQAVKADIRSQRLQKIIDHIRENIEAGSPLWKAMGEVHLFPAHTISLIRIGEDSGKLSDNLRVVSQEQEKDEQFRSKLRSAMMYPLFVLCLSLIIGLGISWFILPKLAVVFNQLKIELPLLTKILIGTGIFLDQHGLLVVPIGLFVFAVVIYFCFFFPKTKQIGQTLLFWVPGVKRLIKEIELARFGYLLGTLLEAGLPITQSLQSLTQATFFPHYKKFYAYLADNVEEGISFQKSFSKYKHLNRLIPTPVQQLIVSGEQSGTLPETLEKISQSYEAKTEVTTKNLTVIMEPVLLVIVWVGVVLVALAVILPIYSLIGNFKTQ